MNDPNKFNSGANQNDDEYPLAPDTEMPQRRLETPWPLKPLKEEQPTTQPFQFTLAELLGLFAVFAVMLAVMTLFPHKWTAAAGLTGAFALLGMILLSVFKPTRMIVHVGWWSLLVIYLLVCVAAVIGGR